MEGAPSPPLLKDFLKSCLGGQQEQRFLEKEQRRVEIMQNVVRLFNSLSKETCADTLTSDSSTTTAAEMQSLFHGRSFPSTNAVKIPCIEQTYYVAASISTQDFLIKDENESPQVLESAIPEQIRQKLITPTTPDIAVPGDSIETVEMTEDETKTQRNIPATAVAAPELRTLISEFSRREMDLKKIRMKYGKKIRSSRNDSSTENDYAAPKIPTLITFVKQCGPPGLANRNLTEHAISKQAASTPRKTLSDISGERLHELATQRQRRISAKRLMAAVEEKNQFRLNIATRDPKRSTNLKTRIDPHSPNSVYNRLYNARKSVSTIQKKTDSATATTAKKTSKKIKLPNQEKMRNTFLRSAANPHLSVLTSPLVNTNLKLIELFSHLDVYGNNVQPKNPKIYDLQDYLDAEVWRSMKHLTNIKKQLAAYHVRSPAMYSSHLAHLVKNNYNMQS